MTVVFPHIPKTGGTALLYHFRQHFGDDQVFILGPHNRVRRFFAGLPQWEELDDDARRGFRVVQGHSVDEETVRHIGSDDAHLVVVLRHPVSLTRSRFNHRAEMVAARTRDAELTPQRFWKAERGNVMASLLEALFPSFVSDPDAPQVERAISILRCFDYVGTTENLERDFAPLLSDLGVGSTIEPRRVATKKRELPVSAEEILERNTADLALYEEAVRLRGEHPATRNPFGHDSQRRRLALDGGAASDVSESGLRIGYEALARGLCAELLAPAALDMLARQGGHAHVRAPDTLRDIIEDQWTRYQDRLSPAKLAQASERAREQASGLA